MSIDSIKEIEYKGELQSGNPREFVAMLFKHKVKMLIVFSLVVMIAIIVSFVMKPVYEANSTLLLKLGREYFNQVDTGDRGAVSIRPEEVINSEIEILTDRDLLTKVVATMKPQVLYPDLAKKTSSRIRPLDAAVIRFRKALKVENIRKSNVLKVTFKHNDPNIAAQAVNLLVEMFKEKHLQVLSDPTSSFFETQLAAYDRKLKESADKLQSFKLKNGVYSLDEQRTLLLKQRTDLDTILKTSQDSIHELQRRQGTLKRQIRTLSSTTTSYVPTERDRIVTEAKTRLLALQVNEKELSQKYRDNNQLVVNLRNEIDMVKQYLKEQEKDLQVKARSSSPVYQGVEMDMMKTQAELSSERAKAATLGHQLHQLDGDIRALDSREEELQNLKRDLAINEKNHQIYLEKTEEARITDDMNKKKLANISVIQTAVAPIEPVLPKKKVNVLIGVILGIISGIAMAVFSERSSNSISTPEIAEKRLGLTVMAVIPYKE